jgi:hypothetical protein
LSQIALATAMSRGKGTDPSDRVTVVGDPGRSIRGQCSPLPRLSSRGLRGREGSWPSLVASEGDAMMAFYCDGLTPDGASGYA